MLDSTPMEEMSPTTPTELYARIKHVENMETLTACLVDKYVTVRSGSPGTSERISQGSEDPAQLGSLILCGPREDES